MHDMIQVHMYKYIYIYIFIYMSYYLMSPVSLFLNPCQVEIRRIPLLAISGQDWPTSTPTGHNTWLVTTLFLRCTLSQRQLSLTVT